jgi:signal transduction histidine kinase
MADDRTGHPGSLGLGLSIVQAIAVAHGAQLRVRPRPGGGLAVTVAFPVLHPSALAPPHAEPVVRPDAPAHQPG